IENPGGETGAPPPQSGGPALEPGGPGSELSGTPSPGCLGLLSGGSDRFPDPFPEPPRTPKLLLSPSPCSAPSPFLLLLIPSAAAHLERRSAVRHTWGGAAPPGGHTWPGALPGALRTRSVFVLGTGGSPWRQREVLREWRRHGDILQGDFPDTYANLTWKTLLLLRWARACCAGAPFLLKADDDVFVNVAAVATHLAAWPAAPPPRLYLGRVHRGVAPNRDPRSRHHVAVATYAAPSFPPYCSGTAYVLSRQAAAAVLGQAGRVPLQLPEDVWVGLCAARAGVVA
ncbi:B3GT5 galactosyltransferase, partial [Chaetops frenatus]|nr:B3GT5 galactosyltransferase [Chaetops frenatus]